MVDSSEELNSNWSQASIGPDHEIIVRIIKPVLDDAIPPYWYHQNAYLTHFLNSLSFIFPPGEEVFVNSVNQFRDQIRDPQLRRDIKGFVSQEFNHSHLHEVLNQWVARHHEKAIYYQKSLKKIIAKGYQLLRKINPKMTLASTAGYEHLTAIMAAQLLKREDVIAKMHGDIKYIFILHAIEEIEHKSVAFDVYEKVHGKYLLRVVSYVFATLFLFFMVTMSTIGMLLDDKQIFNAKSALTAFRELFGIRGFFTGLIPAYFVYFKPGFHPRQIRDTERLGLWRERLARSIPVKELGTRRVVDRDASHVRPGVGA